MKDTKEDKTPVKEIVQGSIKNEKNAARKDVKGSKAKIDDSAKSGDKKIVKKSTKKKSEETVVESFLTLDDDNDDFTNFENLDAGDDNDDEDLKESVDDLLAGLDDIDTNRMLN